MSFACGVQTGSVSVALRDELLAPVEHAPSHLVEHLLDPLDNDPLLLIRCEIDEAGPWQHSLDVLHAAAVGLSGRSDQSAPLVGESEDNPFLGVLAARVQLQPVLVSSHGHLQTKY